jgi:hypothetical protein
LAASFWNNVAAGMVIGVNAGLHAGVGILTILRLLVEQRFGARHYDQGDEYDRTIVVSRVIVAPAVTQHCGTGALSHLPPACTIRSADLARFVWVPLAQASSEAVVRMKAVQVVPPQWAAQRCADAAHRDVRGQ